MSDGEILAVVPEELRRFGAELAARAEGVEKLDVSAQFGAARAGLAGADTALVMVQAADQVNAAFDAVAARLRGLSEIARGNADSYEEADRFAGGQGAS